MDFILPVLRREQASKKRQRGYQKKSKSDHLVPHSSSYSKNIGVVGEVKGGQKGGAGSTSRQGGALGAPVVRSESV